MKNVSLSTSGSYYSSTPTQRPLPNTPLLFQQISFPRQDLDTIVSILAGALTLPGGNDDDDDGEGSKSPPPPPGVSAAFARDFNAVTRQTLGGAKNGATSSAANGRGSGGSSGGNSAQRFASSTLPDLKDLAASGRSVGWFLRLASTAVGLLRDDEKGVTRRALARAGEMLAPDSHALALRSLSVTQVGAWSGVGGREGW